MTGKSDVLFDVPVSNHGARVRMIIAAKGITDLIEVKPTKEIEVLNTNDKLPFLLQGKIPVYQSSEGLTISESDTIVRYVLNKFPQGPSFYPEDQNLRCLSEQITRFHDIYITPIQGCMYKKQGYKFSVYGTDRKSALNELFRQLLGLESILENFNSKFPSLSLAKQRTFLCGSNPSIADVTLYPTMVFCNYMLPRYFEASTKDYQGAVLEAWFEYMSTRYAPAMAVKAEIEAALDGWEKSGRFGPIMEEMKA